MHMRQKVLERLGLTPTEAKVYLVLLQLGQTIASRIIRKAELHRATIYDVLERLQEKGLASHIMKDGKRLYMATEPERFRYILQEREQELKEQQALFNELKPELDALSQSVQERYPAEILVGKGGLKTAFDDVLHKGKTFYALGAQGNFQKYVPDYHWIWHQQLQKKRIKCRMIYAEKCRKLRTKEFPLPYADIRFIEKVYDAPTTTHFYGDVVLIVMWAEQPLVIRIVSPELVGHYKTFFNLIWKMAKP